MMDCYLGGKLYGRRWIVCVAAVSSCAGMFGAPIGRAEPELYADTPAEQRYVLQVDDLFALRHPDKPILDVGDLACTVRRSGMSSDQAKVAVSNKLRNTYGMVVPGAVAGSIVHIAVDNLCSEVGYP